MNVRNDNLDPPKSQARLASVMDFRKPALLLGASVQFNVRSNLELGIFPEHSDA